MSLLYCSPTQSICVLSCFDVALKVWFSQSENKKVYSEERRNQLILNNSSLQLCSWGGADSYIFYCLLSTNQSILFLQHYQVKVLISTKQTRILTILLFQEKYFCFNITSLEDLGAATCKSCRSPSV